MLPSYGWQAIRRQNSPKPCSIADRFLLLIKNTRPVLLVSIVLLTGVAAVAVRERWRWLGEPDAQCEAARPLVQERASRDAILHGIEGLSGEYGSADARWLITQFGERSDKGRDIASNLTGSNRLLLYSRSNSVMFVYLDDHSRAIRAQCFLQ